MRIRISTPPPTATTASPKNVIQILRLTPRNHDGQYVVNWHDRRVAGLPAASARRRVRQYLPRFHRRGPVQRALTVSVEGEVETRDTARRRPRRDRAFPPSAVPARHAADHAGCGDRRRSPQQRRRAPGRTTQPRCSCISSCCEPQSRDHLRHRSDPCRHHRRRSVRAQARRLPGPHPYLHRRGAQPRHSGALCQRPFPPQRRRDRAGRRPRLGRGLCATTSAGSASIRPTASAPPTRMCGSRSGSTISAPRRCAARATGGAGETLHGRRRGRSGPAADRRAESVAARSVAAGSL